MSEININKMVEMAGEREGWEFNPTFQSVFSNKESFMEGYSQKGVTARGKDGEFIAQAPRAILALHQQVQNLQVANAALQAQVGVFEGLHPPDESPPLHYADDGAKYFRFEAYEKVEALVRMPLVKQMHFGKDKKEGLVETEWQGGNSPFFGYRIPHEQVIGWRPLPDESPTAAESEE